MNSFVDGPLSCSYIRRPSVRTPKVTPAAGWREGEDICIRIDGIKKKETVEAAKPQLAKLDFASISVATLIS